MQTRDANQDNLQYVPASIKMGGGLKKRGHWTGRLDFVFSLIGYSVGFGNVWRFPYLCYKNGGGYSVGFGNVWRFPYLCYKNGGGYSVGLGNVWRFPYLCFKNGGGAFLIPYFICLGVAGLPLLMLELGLGQFMSQGGITCWNMIPGWKGVGIASIVIGNWLVFYYNIIMAWDLYYLVLSFQKRLPWSHCNNDFNTENCLDPEWIYANTTEQRNNCDGAEDATVHQICINGTFRNLSDFTPAVVELWERKILQQHLSDGIGDPGGINWQLALTLILAWVIIYFIVIKGVKSSGKVVYFTAPFPYVLLTILLVRALTLENAIDGITFYLTPNITRLQDGQVWLDAATQIFFSYSVGLGVMVALGSYNVYNHNFFRDGIIFTFFNSGTSIYSGLVIFSVLGFMAGQQGVSVADVARPGPGLAFIAYPEAVAQMPIPHLWAVLFFFMMLLLGIDSEFVSVEGFVTAVVDTWPQVFRRGYRRELFTLFYCCFACCVGLTMTCYNGIYIFQLFDYYSASGFVLLWVAFFESIAVAYFYDGFPNGGLRYIENLNDMLKFRDSCHAPIRWVWAVFEKYLLLSWYVLTPLFCLCIFIFSLVGFENLKYQEYVYPTSGYALGWFLALSSMVMVPLYFVYTFLSAEGSLKDRLHVLISCTPKIPNRDEKGEVIEDVYKPIDSKDTKL